MVYPENYVAAPTVTDDINKTLLKSAEERLNHYRAGLKGIEVSVEIRMGRPFSEITEVAAEMNVDVIILATHGYTGLKHVLLGSTAERVVRHAPCPVLTVRVPEHDFVSPA